MSGFFAPPVERVHAPDGWRTVDLISDLHLKPGEGATFELWKRYLQDTPADAVFILGDLFEAWVGDDAADAPGFAADCMAVLKSAAGERPLFFMHGNRDFLVGTDLMRTAGVTLVNDPCVLAFGGRSWLLSHGDALCLADVDYLRFRATVRADEWQRAFLAMPLAQRQAVARHLRSESEARKQPENGYADVDGEAADALLDACGATAMIHGHTHRPADHALPSGRQRIVLSDWDAAAIPIRAEVLRLGADGPQRIAIA